MNKAFELIPTVQSYDIEAPALNLLYSMNHSQQSYYIFEAADDQVSDSGVQVAKSDQILPSLLKY